ncbi:uncharacterized protein LOC122402865 isoform X2 [Colletes gigas]|uniref:uncharacterized protein LOC122402865 isoform X2 n=1 Tax=Colletes gigas TaxID=935657 RepID=UPI001C9B8CFA|nr:uncharacterized protein LOC122402865 isoform X2 [Colletes gigas]
MSDSGDCVKYKWIPESTALLVSVWSDRQVQKQFEYTSKPQLIWESVARYMKKKGYNVSAKQCRSRMKQVLVCYREAKRAGTRAGVEQYYESIDRVLKNKRLEGNNLDGVDTVDAMMNVKSPPKDIKTNKNLQMRYRFQEPPQSLHHTEALSPIWTLGRENEYPDSPESNETVIARPYRVFSPTRDVAINTDDQLGQMAGRSTQCDSFPEEILRPSYDSNLLPGYPYVEIPFQNTVQNVQNHIIQENMQQHQNLQQTGICNEQNMLVNNLAFQQNLHNLNQNLTTQFANIPVNPMTVQSCNLKHVMQQRNNLQHTTRANNRAMPQEPQKLALSRDLRAAYKQQYDYLPDASQHLNDAFCQSKNDEKTHNINDGFCESKNDEKVHNLNESYNQSTQVPNPDISVITNNATCNDDSLLLEFLLNSSTPSESDNKSKDAEVNTENIPHVPVRKKKAQKLEQLFLSAINSQNEAVNKILAAQNDILTKFLDIDRDRQNRFECRVDDLLKVVHTSVHRKQNSETDVEIPPPQIEPIITSLVPPPRPGAPPPKLDLVPPKPCRVPCTVPNSNIELINQNPIATRPGVVSPITSPVKKPGTIWSKLGPVSQSPFVKAQQRLGYQSASTTNTRTQSSAERRIAREMENIAMNIQAVKFETTKFLEMEKRLEETIENARLEATIGQTLHARRQLFIQREPTAAVVLTAAFLENERRTSEQIMNNYDMLNINEGNLKTIEDDLLAGQGESYEHLRKLTIQPTDVVPGEPCNTSTPAKLGTVSNNRQETSVAVPKQTIQQLAQLVMNTGRWKDLAAQNEQKNSVRTIQGNVRTDENVRAVGYNEEFPTAQPNTMSRENQIKDDKSYVRDWMLNRYGVTANEQKTVYGPPSCNTVNKNNKFPIGFTTTMLDTENPKQKDSNSEVCKPLDYNNHVLPGGKQQSVRFMDEALAELHRMYMERVSKEQQEINDSLPYATGNGNATISVKNRQMIEKYIHEIMPRKQFGDNKDKDTDSDNDEFLDTTATMPTIVPRRGSLTSTGTGSTGTTHSIKFSKPDNCIIS